MHNPDAARQRTTAVLVATRADRAAGGARSSGARWRRTLQQVPWQRLGTGLTWTVLGLLIAALWALLLLGD